jgi:cell division protein FtsX
MEDMEFLKAMLAEMNATQETMERQISSLVSIMEAARKTDRDEIKQEIRAGQEHIKEIMETQFASLAAKLDGWRKEMQADREARKTTDLKANPEEMGVRVGTWGGP